MDRRFADWFASADARCRRCAPPAASHGPSRSGGHLLLPWPTTAGWRLRPATSRAPLPHSGHPSGSPPVQLLPAERPPPRRSVQLNWTTTTVVGPDRTRGWWWREAWWSRLVFCGDGSSHRPVLCSDRSSWEQAMPRARPDRPLGDAQPSAQRSASDRARPDDAAADPVERGEGAHAEFVGDQPNRRADEEPPAGAND